MFFASFPTRVWVYLYVRLLNQSSWASELTKSSCRWQAIHLEQREGKMHNEEDRGEDERTLCALWRGWASQRLASPKIRTQPQLEHFLCSFCSRKGRVSTNDEHLWYVLHVWTDGVRAESEEGDRGFYFTSGVWVTCWPSAWNLFFKAEF